MLDGYKVHLLVTIIYTHFYSASIVNLVTRSCLQCRAPREAFDTLITSWQEVKNVGQWLDKRELEQVR